MLEIVLPRRDNKITLEKIFLGKDFRIEGNYVVYSQLCIFCYIAIMFCLPFISLLL